MTLPSWRSGSNPVRRANSSISCWSAGLCCAWAISLAAAGLSRSLATSIAATTLVPTGKSASRPATVAARSSPRRQPPRQEPSVATMIKAGKKTRVRVIVPRMSSGWARMRFKGGQVFVRADESGRPVLDAEGRAEMKYRESDAKSYRPVPGNLMPDAGPPATVTTPAPARERPHAETAQGRHRQEESGGVAGRRGGRDLDRRRLLGEPGPDGDRRGRSSTAASGASKASTWASAPTTSPS